MVCARLATMEGAGVTGRRGVFRPVAAKPQAAGEAPGVDCGALRHSTDGAESWQWFSVQETHTRQMPECLVVEFGQRRGVPGSSESKRGCVRVWCSCAGRGDTKQVVSKMDYLGVNAYQEV